MMGTPLGRILLDRPAWTYLLGPFFKASTPDAAAPLSATYREAGAVGALTMVQVDGQLSTSGGALVVPAQATPAWGDLGAVAVNGVARVAGRALLTTFRPTLNTGTSVPIMFGAGAGVSYTQTVDTLALAPSSSSKFYLLNSGGTLGDVGQYQLNTTYRLGIILRSTGAFFVLSGGIYGVTTLLYVLNAGNTATLYPTIANLSNVWTQRDWRVADLGGAWASDYGICTDRKATSAATDTITHTANCLIEHTITAATGVTQELWVRRTDASNGWIVRMDQAGSTIKLIEMVAGVETERASTAQTWTNGSTYRVVVICDGTTITPYVANVAKTGYSSASTNQSATTAYVSDAGVDFCSWPRVVSLPSGI